jgi:site-specific DNA recombinase
MKTAVIYARYSSDSQTEQSIEGQLRVCQQYAQNNDILIVDTYIDRAMTGTNDLRPDFQRMIKDSNKRQWDYILVYKLDRFSRNKYETTIHKHTLSNNGVKVLSAMENIPDTPEGIILESLLEGMNQYYSAELSQKVHRGLNESYIKGLFTGGLQIYGYKVVDKKSVIDENEAVIVKEIFTRFAQGETGKSIADNLIARGIRTKRGHYLDDKQVYKIIANPKYTGIVVHGDKTYTNIYPAIIDEKTWQKVQAIRNANKHKPGSKKERFNYVLSGRLICGECKEFMVGVTSTNRFGSSYRYYTCLSRRRKKHQCNMLGIHKDILEDFVFEKVWEMIFDNNNIDELVNDICKKHKSSNEENELIKSLDKKRMEAIKASNNLISAIEQGIITEQTKIRLKELENQIAQYDFDIEQAKQRNYSYLTPELVHDYFRKVLNGDIKDIEVCKHITRLFIREVILYEDKIVITFNFTDKTLIKKTIPDDIEEIEETIKKRPEMTVLNNNDCVYKNLNIPPVEVAFEHQGKTYSHKRCCRRDFL